MAAPEGRGRGRGVTTAEQEEADMERFLQVRWWLVSVCVPRVVLTCRRQSGGGGHGALGFPAGTAHALLIRGCCLQTIGLLQELEEDPEMRARVALYKDPNFDPAAVAAAAQGGMGESGALGVLCCAPLCHAVSCIAALARSERQDGQFMALGQQHAMPP